MPAYVKTEKYSKILVQETLKWPVEILQFTRRSELATHPVVFVVLIFMSILNLMLQDLRL